MAKQRLNFAGASRFFCSFLILFSARLYGLKIRRGRLKEREFTFQATFFAAVSVFSCTGGGTSCIMGNARAHYLLLLNIRVHLLFQNDLRYICRKQLRQKFYRTIYSVRWYKVVDQMNSAFHDKGGIGRKLKNKRKNQSQAMINTVLVTKVTLRNYYSLERRDPDRTTKKQRPIQEWN